MCIKEKIGACSLSLSLSASQRSIAAVVTSQVSQKLSIEESSHTRQKGCPNHHSQTLKGITHFSKLKKTSKREREREHA